MTGAFIWRDAGRTVVFRHGGVAQAPQLLRENGFGDFELLGTPRGLAGADELVGAAATVHEVPPGGVPAAAAGLLGRVEGPRLVALGGGRAIDATKAVAAVTGAEVAAIPTTMSGAEMTGIHRLPEGVSETPGGLVRPSVVIADPGEMTSQPEPQLRASSMNALAHGADSICTPLANPVSQMAAVRGAELIAAALDQERSERDPSALALGSVLCGYAIDSALFGVHHVICQALAQVCGTPHAETNAAVLPVSLSFLVAHAPAQMADFLAALGSDPEDVAARVRELGGNPAGLGALVTERERLDEAIEAMLRRVQLAYGPHPPDRQELEQLVESAW